MTREESEKRYEEFAKENKRWNEKIDKAIDAMAEGAKSDERWWSIRHQEHVGAQVAGPPTEWVEVVPAARLAEVEAEAIVAQGNAHTAEIERDQARACLAEVEAENKRLMAALMTADGIIRAISAFQREAEGGG